jgi:hypothetical protein
MKALVLTLLATSCATVVPMQTASVVGRGALRVGGALSASAYCGRLSDGVLLGLARCTEYPDGIPLPELRVNGRVGLGDGVDVGASVQGLLQLLAPERAGQVGATIDVKGELLRVEGHGVNHIVSMGLLGGGAVAGRFGLPAWAQLEWGVPVFYGLQLDRWEFVLGASVSQRQLVSGFAFARPLTFDSTRVGFTLGVFRRGPSAWAAQLGYLTDPARFTTGSTQVQFGWFWDVR